MLRSLRHLACAVALLLAISQASAGEPSISAPDAFQQARNGDLVVIDVRSPREWRQTGIPAGAKAITMHDPEGLGAFLKNLLRSVEGDRNARIAMICARGNRSHSMQQFLTQNGFTRVLDVSEGMLGRGRSPGWLARNLPVEACTRC